MLKSIRIQNFQSHIDTTILFEQGVNAITGSSDAGKSAILRALKWLFFNRPRGEGFKNTNAKNTAIISVTAIFDDVIIERHKGPDVNSYVITPILPDGKLGPPNLCKALRSAVPDEVKEVLRITDINFQEQHSPYFLLNDTSGEVASAFNRVSGLSIMDGCMLEANRLVSSLRSKEKQIIADISDTEEQINDLVWTIEADNLLSDIEKYKARIDELDAKIATLENITSQHKKIIIQINRLSYLSDADKAIETLTRIAQNARDYKEKEERIQSILESKNRFMLEIQQLKKLLVSKKCILDLEDLLDEEKNINAKIKTLSSIVSDMRKYKRSQIQLEAAVISAKDTFDKALRSAKVCPLCESKLI